MKRVLLLGLILIPLTIGCTSARGTTNLDTLHLSQDLIVDNDGSIGDDLTVGDDLIVSGDFVLAGGLTANTVTITDTLTVGGTMTGTNAIFTGTLTAEQLTSTDDALITDDLTVGGGITITGAISSTDFVQFDTSYSDGHGEGKLHWNSDDGTLEVGMPGGNVIAQLGQEILILVKNDQGAPIDNGSVLYVSGASGNRPEVRLGQADAAATARTALLVATEDIGLNQQGYATTDGLVRDIDTDGMAEGSVVYLSADTAGTFTTTIPTAPNFTVAIGVVLREHASEGILLVSPVVVPRLSALSDVYSAGLADGKFPIWDGIDARFEFTSSITVTSAALETGGSITYTDTFWDDLRVPLSTAKTAGSNVPVFEEIASSGVYAWNFDDGDEIWFAAQMSHAYKRGSDIHPHVHWGPETNVSPADNVGMGLECSWSDIGDGVSSTSVYTSVISTGINTQYDHLIDDIGSDWDGSGITGVSSMILCRFYRFAASVDNYGAGIFVYEVDFHYEINKPGSDTEYD